MTHPYKNLPPRNFWSRCVAGVPGFELDPSSAAPFRILPDTRVATAGSCFAQHIARALRSAGLNHYVTEDGDEQCADEATRRNYGVFSARYGNIYTARQLLQLFKRAFELEAFDVPPWHGGQGWVDPFRPAVEPDEFPDVDALERDRRHHLECVRRMFETLDVFVFTLGLTEAWVHAPTGAVVPLAPGVSGGSWRPADGEFHFRNFRFSEVFADMAEFITALRGVNAAARVVLTVSPVPLAATYEQRHVLVSNGHSKAVLRAVAGEIEQSVAGVTYFPSYEIITLPALGHGYFADDLRSIEEHGVSHVMRIFLLRFAGEDGANVVVDQRQYAETLRNIRSVVCDEELIERAV